jgi:hypothetical protein
MFGVLRRPAGSEDSLPFKKAFREALAFQLRSYYPNSVRLLVKEHGERYLLVLGFRRGFPIPPARCLPKDIQSIRPRLVAEEQKREHELVYCIVNPTDEFYEGINCQSLSELERGEQFVTFVVSKSEHIDLIPDRVATVRLSYIDGTVLSTSIMNENVLTFTTPQDVLKQARANESRAEKAFKALRRGHLDKRQRMRAEHDFAELAKRVRLELTPKTIEWYDSAGHLINTMNPPALGGREILVITSSK